MKDSPPAAVMIVSWLLFAVLGGACLVELRHAWRTGIVRTRYGRLVDRRVSPWGFGYLVAVNLVVGLVCAAVCALIVVGALRRLSSG